MDTMKSWTLFFKRKRALLLLVMSLAAGQAMAQVEVKRVFPSEKDITSFDNTTFCTAFLADEKLWTLRDIPVADVYGVQKIVFNPTGSSLALIREKKLVKLRLCRVLVQGYGRLLQDYELAWFEVVVIHPGLQPP